MNIEKIIHAWKEEEDLLDEMLPVSPVGEELTEEELLRVDGGCDFTCGTTIFCGVNGITCGFTVG